ncbi:MAG TPA: S-methyl-5'-thioadenosine phosphorylase [Chloroflexota bacterium]|nr:S-methyl-5'-thioadenosine phosphorylase [Chloroflexota bacterium]
MVAQADIGVIGGSGLYQIEGLESIDQVEIDTPFGRPSDVFTVGTLEGVRVAFLPRHGRGHRLLPSEVPARANLFAFRLLGVRQVLSLSAVGSLREELEPMDMVVPDQLFDRTKARPSTFFGNGIVAHVSLAEPFCRNLRDALQQASTSVVPRTHAGGTYVCMEGPAFSTYAESMTYRQLGFAVIGMTALPEAKLAREAGLCYGLLAQVTDYDCWHSGHESVTSDMVMANVARNSANARAILRRCIPLLQPAEDCSCRHALDGAIATSPDAIDPETRRRLAPLLP